MNKVAGFLTTGLSGNTVADHLTKRLSGYDFQRQEDELKRNRAQVVRASMEQFHRQEMPPVNTPGPMSRPETGSASALSPAPGTDWRPSYQTALLPSSHIQTPPMETTAAKTGTSAGQFFTRTVPAAVGSALEEIGTRFRNMETGQNMERAFQAERNQPLTYGDWGASLNNVHAGSKWIRYRALLSPEERRHAESLSGSDLGAYINSLDLESRARQKDKDSRADSALAWERGVENAKPSASAAGVQIAERVTGKRYGSDWRRTQKDFEKQTAAATINAAAFLSDAQKETIRRYADAGDFQAVAKYYSALSPDLTAQAQEALDEAQRQKSSVSALAAAASAPASGAVSILAGIPAFGAVVWQHLKNEVSGSYTPVDYNSAAFSLLHSAQSMREGGQAYIQDRFQDSPAAQTGLSLLYSGVSSGVTNLGQLALGTKLLGLSGRSLERFTLGTMSLSSAGQSTYEHLRNGQDAGTALANGVMSGLVEYMTETAPIHLWTKNMEDLASGNVERTAKNLMKMFAVRAGSEAWEEVVGNVTEQTWDILFNGEQSAFSTAVREIVEEKARARHGQGDSGGTATDEDMRDARKQAFLDLFLAKSAEAAASAALSVFLMDGVPVAVDTLSDHYVFGTAGREIRQNGGTEAVRREIDKGLLFPDDSPAHQQAVKAAAAEERGKLDNRELGRLSFLNANALTGLFSEIEEHGSRGARERAWELYGEVRENIFDKIPLESVRELADLARGVPPSFESWQARHPLPEGTEIAGMEELTRRFNALDLDASGQPLVSYQDALQTLRERYPSSSPAQLRQLYTQYRNDTRTVLFGGERLTRTEFGALLRQANPSLPDSRIDDYFNRAVLDTLDGSDAYDRYDENSDRMPAETAEETAHDAKPDEMRQSPDGTDAKKRAVDMNAEEARKNAVREIIQFRQAQMETMTPEERRKYSGQTGLFRDGGQYIVTDGTRLLRLNDDIPELLHAKTPPNNMYGYIDRQISTGQLNTDGETVQLPSAEYLRRYQIHSSEDAPVLVDSMDGAAYFSAGKLLDMMDALPGAVIYKPLRPVAPMYFRSEYGDGILLPLRPRIAAQNYNSHSLVQARQAADQDSIEPVQAGRATVIQRPYQGIVPVQTHSSGVTPVVSMEKVNQARNYIRQAQSEERAGSRSFKSALKAIYNKIFQRSTGVPVEGMAFQGQPYLVDIGKKVPGKVISDPNLRPEKLALLDMLPDIVRNAEYVGSGKYTSHGAKEKNVFRYDYFETPVIIGNRQYAVKFDVEILAGSNNYRTHQIVEMDLIDSKARLVGPAPTPSSEGSSPSTDTVPQAAQSVNGETEDFAQNRTSPMDTERNPTLTEQVEGDTDTDEGALPKGTGAAEAGFTGGLSEMEKLADINGAIKPGELNPELGGRASYVPKTISGRDRVSFTARTVYEAKATPEERLKTIEDAVMGGKLSHIPYPDTSAKAQAERTLREKKWNKTLSDWTEDVRSGKSGKDLVALGACLLNNAGNNTDCSGAEYADILVDYSNLLTRAGQSVQAARLLKQLSPEGKLYSAQKYVDDINRAQRDNMKPTDRKAAEDGEKGAKKARKRAVERLKEEFDAVADETADRKRDHGLPVQLWMREVGNKLAGQLSSRLEPPAKKDTPITKTIQQDLLQFAENYVLPQKPKSGEKRSAAMRVRDYLNNRENYAKAWNQARDALREKYRDNPAALDAFEEFLQGTISYSGAGSDAVMLRAVADAALAADENTRSIAVQVRMNNRQGVEARIYNALTAAIQPADRDAQILRDAVKRYVQNVTEEVSGDVLGREIGQTMRKLGVELCDLIQFGAADRDTLGAKIAELLMERYSVDENAAQSVSDTVLEHFRQMAEEETRKELDRLFPSRPSWQQRQTRRKLQNLFDELVDTGAFFSNKFDRLNRGSLGSYITIDPALMDDYRKAGTDAERDSVMDRIVQNVADQVSPSLMDKFTALRYTAMLGNLRTQTRNILGNAGFQPVVAAKNMLAAQLERAAVRAGLMDESERTKTVTYRKSDYLAAREDFHDFRDLIMSGGKTDSPDTTFAGRVRDARAVFGTENNIVSQTVGRAMEQWRTKTNWAMDMGDLIFCQHTYAATMARYLKAHEITMESATEEQLDRARALAVREAAEATYRDNNALSEMILGIGFRDPKGNIWKHAANTLSQGILPFRKTPANVLVRAFEYSPLGVFQTAFQALEHHHGAEISASDIINQLSKNLTGTALAAMGYSLAQAGILSKIISAISGGKLDVRLTGFGGEDEELRKFHDMQGIQQYALIINGNSYTIDWLAPEAIPMFLGANLYEAAKEDHISRETALKILSGVSDPILEMSFMSGVKDMFDNIAAAYDSDSSAMEQFVMNAFYSYLAQAQPTILGQAERAASNRRQSFYADDDAHIGSWRPDSDTQYQLSKLFNKVPGIDLWQIDYIDAWGRTQSSFETNWSDTVDGILNAANQLALPGYQRKIHTSPMEDELERLYLSTGDEEVLPHRAKQTITVEGVRKRFTAGEYVSFAQERGQKAWQDMTALVASAEYTDKNTTDEQRAEMVRQVFKDAQKAAQAPYELELRAQSEKARKAAEEAGITQEQYKAFLSATDGMESLKNRDGNSISGSASAQKALAIHSLSGLSAKQREFLMDLANVGKSYRDLTASELREQLERMREKAKA